MKNENLKMVKVGDVEFPYELPAGNLFRLLCAAAKVHKIDMITANFEGRDERGRITDIVFLGKKRFSAKKAVIELDVCDNLIGTFKVREYSEDDEEFRCRSRAKMFYIHSLVKEICLALLDSGYKSAWDDKFGSQGDIGFDLDKPSIFINYHRNAVDVKLSSWCIENTKYLNEF